jgi:tryptophanyl-tRNA synthetase
MAADIVLYDTQLVPVGKDQKQHIELARTLAQRFNHKFGETFVIPEAYTKKESENIMGLDDPTKKMSKSAKSEYNYIALNDDAETVRKKIKKAVTDSGSEVVYQEDKPALKNLINIYSLLADKTPKEVEKLFAGKKYSDFKTELAEVIIKFLAPFQKKIGELSDEKVLAIMEDGAKKVRPLAKKKLEEVKKKIGFIV